MKIVILCGGRGTRLGLGDLPKPMVPIDGMPLLERLVRLGVDQGYKDFLFLAGHGAQVLQDHFGDGSDFGCSIEHVVETVPLGTAGCFRDLQARLTEPFIVLYGDILIDVDLRAFAQFALSKGGAGSLFVHPNDHPEDSDLLEADQDGRIIAFHAKPHPAGARYPNLVSAALYVLYPVALDSIPAEGASDWGRDVFPALYQAQPLYAYRSVEYAKDIGTPARLARGEGHIRAGRLESLSHHRAKPAIFLDRDGVINEERDGLRQPADAQLIPGIAQAIRAANDAGIPVICVTNQPFLAKGQLDWTTLRAIGGEIDCQLADAAGAYLDDILICPHHPEKGWAGEIAELKIICECRKPAPGMLLRAAAFHNIDLKRSWMVGDRYCDIEAGARAGTRTALVNTGYGGSDKDQYAVSPDAIFPDGAVAIQTILKRL